RGQLTGGLRVVGQGGGVGEDDVERLVALRVVEPHVLRRDDDVALVEPVEVLEAGGARAGDEDPSGVVPGEEGEGGQDVLGGPRGVVGRRATTVGRGGQARVVEVGPTGAEVEVRRQRQ